MNVPHLPAGKNPPDDVYVYIENSKGTSGTKLEWDPAIRQLTLARQLAEPVTWPYNYGFINHTLAGDGDALDAFVVMDELLPPGTVVQARIIAGVITEDQDGPDIKLVCVPWWPNQSYTDLHFANHPPMLAIDRIKAFYLASKALSTGKWVKVNPELLSVKQSKASLITAMEEWARTNNASSVDALR